MRTAMTVASTRIDEIASVDAEIPVSSSITLGSCSPINRNANDSRTS
jgi:hypothetical protein